MTLQDWGKILPSWQEEFADRFVELSGNCVFTGRGGYTYDMEETENNGKTRKEFVKSGVKMKMAGETPFEPDLNIWMEQCQEMQDNGKPKVWREALIMKDRSSLIDGKTFINPTFKVFEPVVDYLIDIPKGEVVGASKKENLAPSENHAGYERRENVAIELENIKALFDQYKFGTSGQDKQRKILIFKKFIGTASATSMEKMLPSDLKNSRIMLERFFEGWNHVDDKDVYINTYEIPLITQ